MSNDRSSLLRKLTPKSYHFDGYNEVNYPNTRDKPFFSENVVPIGDYYLTTRIDYEGRLILEYSSVCPNGMISFEPYILSFESFISLLRTALEEDSDFITFEIRPIYRTNYRKCIGCAEKNKDCSSLLKGEPSSVMAAVSFDVTDIKYALAVYFGINKSQTTKGGYTMKGNSMKKMLGMDFELGLSKDRNIASTLMGVAVRNPETDQWFTFDPNTHTRTNIAGFKLGNLPIYILPVSELPVGALTMMDKKYYYVQEVDDKYFTLLGAADGFVVKKLKTESLIPGMTLYAQVFACDINTLRNPASNENLSGNFISAILMMQWASGGNSSEFSLDNITDDSFNGLGSLLPLLLASGNSSGLGSMFSNTDGTLNFPLLMALGSGDGSGDMDEMMQLVVLNQLMNGGKGTSMFGAIPGLTPAASVPTPAISTTAAGEVYCPKCGETYPAGTNFCSKCGEATQVKGKVCANCGTTLHDGAAFCHNCGQKVVIDVCPKCGAKVTPDASFCSSCGTSLKPVAPKRATSGNKSTTAKRSTAPKKKPETATAVKSEKDKE